MNGTFVNGVRVRDADLPARECRIGLGDSVVLVRMLASAALVEVPAEPSFGDLCGSSLVMRQLFGMLARVAVSDATVLLEGESGTGKELVASEIVRRGPRAERPFAIIDCSALSPTLMESELFGHARGAFTGADRARVGVFESADGGTVLLDEIGELPLEMQSRLLRVLEAGEVRRVGENEQRKIDVRVIAATNRRLDQEVNRGRFREDLYFRLSVVTVRLPPLRRRLDDLEQLVRVLLASMNADASIGLFTPEVLTRLRQYDWPGNVRELRNYVERSVILGAAAQPGDHGSTLPPATSGDEPALGELDVDLSVPLRIAKEQLVSSFERRYLTRLLEATEGNVSRAARQAKIDRMHLYRLLQRYGLRTGLDK
jgi:DNA-binding NtrC family response regulator